MAAAFAALAVASSPHPPRFDGMFLSLNSQTALWDTSMWKRDLEAMKTAQLRFFAVPHLARQIGPATAACPSVSRFTASEGILTASPTLGTAV